MSPQDDWFLCIYLFFFAFMKGWAVVTFLACGTPQNKLLINEPKKVLYIKISVIVWITP